MHPEIKKFWEDAGYELEEMGSGSFGSDDGSDWLIRTIHLKRNGKYIHHHEIAVSEKILEPITQDKLNNVKFYYYYPATPLVKLPPPLLTEEEMLRIMKLKAFI